VITNIQGDPSQPVRSFISLRKAVRFSGYSEQYMRRLARRKAIKAIKFGHAWMIDQQSLEEYMDRAVTYRLVDKRFGPREPE
jgi:helix-turn-helix protein